MNALEKQAQSFLTRTLRVCAGLKRWYPGQPARLQAEIAFLSSAQMRKLNREFRRKDYTTDVLSFPSPQPLQKLGHLGELVICLPVLKRQAIEHGHSIETELAVLIVHGALHLLGLDHEQGPTQFRKQLRYETQILERLKIRADAGLIARTG